MEVEGGDGVYRAPRPKVPEAGIDVHQSRSSYAALAIAALLPIVLFASVIATVVGFREQAALRERALSNVREIANGIDRFVAAQLKAAEVMARSRTLDHGDLAGFYEFAARLKASESDWVSVVLLDTQGDQLLNLALPFGAPLPRSSDPASFRK